MTEKRKKLKVGCGWCEFTTETAEELLVHMMATGHGNVDKADLADSQSFSELSKVLEQIMANPEDPQVPGLDIEAISEDDLPDEVREGWKNRKAQLAQSDPNWQPAREQACPVCHTTLNEAKHIKGPEPGTEAKGTLSFCAHCDSLLLVRADESLVPAPQEIIDEPEVQAMIATYMEARGEASARKASVSAKKAGRRQ